MEQESFYHHLIVVKKFIPFIVLNTLLITGLTYYYVFF
jgi:hypothetical protein